MPVGAEKINCLGKRTVSLDSIELMNSVPVDGINWTLYFVGRICDTGQIVVFAKSRALFISHVHFSISVADIAKAATMSPETQLYEINKNSSLKANEAKITSTINVWHKGLAHTNVKNLQSLCEHTTHVPRFKGKLESCHPRITSKAKRKLFGSSFEPTEHRIEMVHFNLCRKPPSSVHGNKQFCTFIDHCSRYTECSGN